MKLSSLTKSLLVAAAAALLFTPLGGCGNSRSNSDGPQFAYVTNGVASFWTVAEAGAKQAAKDADVNITVIMPAGLTDQTRKIEDLLTRGVDGIAVSPINAENQVDILNKAAEATNLVTHDSDAPKSNRLAYVGMDNYEAGRMSGKLVREALPDGGKVMLFIGRLDQDNAQLRRQGCIDAILELEPDPSRRNPVGSTATSYDGKYEVLGTMTDEFDPAKAKANAEDSLTRHPDVAAMVGLFVYNPPAILEALDRAGKVGEVKIIGFDEDPVTLQAIKDGKIFATVVQDPYQYGYESIRILIGLHKGDKSVLPEGGFIDVPPRVINKENLDEFWATLKERLGKE
jgi:ribose transport system substrate-binding protein